MKIHSEREAELLKYVSKNTYYGQWLRTPTTKDI
jgi:hypothetical protein